MANRRIVSVLAAAWLVCLSAGAFAQTTIPHNESVTATSPLPTGSCMYIDQGPGTDAKLCSGYAAAFGAAASNATTTLGLSTLTLGGTTTSVAGLTLTASPSLALRDTSAAFDLTLGATSSTTLTNGRALTFDVANGSRTVKLASNLTIVTDPGAVDGALKANGTGTFSQAACSDLSNATTACSTAIGTSGAAIPLLNGANTWSGVQSYNVGDLQLKGANSGGLVVNAAAVAGTNTLTLPAGTTDFSATGGTSQVVKQLSLGGAFTVGQLACSDLSVACTTGSGTTNTVTKWTGGGALGNSTIVDTGAGVTIGSPGTGALGAGTVNVAGGLYVNGAVVGTGSGNVVASGMSTNAIPLATSGTGIGNSEMTDAASGGVVVGSATGGQKGAGTINAVGVYSGGTQLTPSPVAGNPTGTIGVAANNGSAVTWMRSDATPAIPQCSAATFGACKPDGTTITAANGVISAATGGPTVTDGTTTVTGSSSISFGTGFKVSGTSPTAVINGTTPDRTATSSTSFGAADMAGQVNLNGSSLTLTIPAISSTVFASGMSAVAADFGTTNVSVSSTPTVNGCPSTIYPGGFAAYSSNGTSLDCFGFPGWGQLLGQPNTFSAAQTFSEVHGTLYSPTFTTNAYTLQASDCGKTLKLANGAAGAINLFSYNGSCTIVLEQADGFQYTVTNAGGATFASVNSYTKTKGQYATITVYIDTPSGSAAHWVLTGDGA